MNATSSLPVVGIDLAKNVFEVAVAHRDWRIVERTRLSRAQFERWFANRVVDQTVMEACGSAHHWGRWFAGQGIEAKLLPARYVRAYVKRNKTDAADAAALLEAARASDIVPVRVKSVEQQALQALHRTRSLWMGTRTSRINALRGFCREFGVDIRPGSRVGLEQIGRVLADPRSALLELLRATMKELLEEIRLLEVRIGQLERELAALARQSGWPSASQRRRSGVSPSPDQQGDAQKRGRNEGKIGLHGKPKRRLGANERPEDRNDKRRPRVRGFEECQHADGEQRGWTW